MTPPPVPVVVHQHPPARQEFPLQPHRRAGGPQPHPVPDDPRPARSRAGPPHTAARSPRPTAGSGVSDQASSSAVPPRISPPGCGKKYVLSAPGVIHRREPRADPRGSPRRPTAPAPAARRIRHQLPRTQPRAVDDDAARRPPRDRSPYAPPPLRPPRANRSRSHRRWTGMSISGSRAHSPARVLLGRRRPQPRPPGGPRTELVQRGPAVYTLDHAYARLVGPGRQLLVHGQATSAHSPTSPSGSIR